MGLERWNANEQGLKETERDVLRKVNEVLGFG